MEPLNRAKFEINVNNDKIFKIKRSIPWLSHNNKIL